MKTYKLVLSSVWYSLSYVFKTRVEYTDPEGKDCLQDVLPFMFKNHPEARDMMQKFGAPTHMRLERIKFRKKPKCAECGCVMESPVYDIYCINCQ